MLQNLLLIDFQLATYNLEGMNFQIRHFHSHIAVASWRFVATKSWIHAVNTTPSTKHARPNPSEDQHLILGSRDRVVWLIGFKLEQSLFYSVDFHQICMTQTAKTNLGRGPWESSKIS